MNGIAVRVLYTHRTQLQSSRQMARLCKSSHFRNAPLEGADLDSPREGLSNVFNLFLLHYSPQWDKICPQISGGRSHGKPYEKCNALQIQK